MVNPTSCQTHVAQICLVGDSQPLIPLAMAAMHADNETPPYSEQGGV